MAGGTLAHELWITFGDLHASRESVGTIGLRRERIPERQPPRWSNSYNGAAKRHIERLH
jgi:hypothetical protein